MKKIYFLGVIIMMALLTIVGCEKASEKVESEKLYPVLNEESGLYGYVDRKGDYKIKPKFKSADIFNGKYAKVYMDEEGRENIINSKGEFILPEESNYSNILVGNDLISAMTKENKSLLFDKNGKDILGEEYSSIYFCLNGLIQLTNDKNVGFLNSKGKEISPLQPNDTTNIHKEYVTWNNDNTSVVVDFNGKEVIKLKDSKNITGISNDIIINKELNDKYSLYTIKGKRITDAIYDSINLENDGLLQASKDSKFGFISETGEEIIPFIYDSATDFVEGYSCVSIKNKYGIIDKNNNIVIEIKYDDIINKVITNKAETMILYQYVIDDRVAVKENDRVYLLDLQGKRASSSYDNIRYTKGYMIGKVSRITEAGRVDSGYLVINKDDNILSPNFASMEQAPYGLMIVNEKEGKEGYIINNKGEKLNENMYGIYYPSYSQGYDSFVTKKDKGWAVISKEGKEIISFDEKVKEVKIYDDGLYYLIYQDGSVDLIESDGKSLIKK